MIERCLVQSRHPFDLMPPRLAARSLKLLVLGESSAPLCARDRRAPPRPPDTCIFMHLASPAVALAAYPHHKP